MKKLTLKRKFKNVSGFFVDKTPLENLLYACRIWEEHYSLVYVYTISYQPASRSMWEWTKWAIGWQSTCKVYKLWTIIYNSILTYLTAFNFLLVNDLFRIQRKRQQQGGRLKLSNCQIVNNKHERDARQGTSLQDSYQLLPEFEFFLQTNQEIWLQI